LLIHEFALFMVYNIWVQRTLLAGLVARLLAATASPWERKAREATVNSDIFTMVAILAANVDGSRFR
jgi:hypothetical protein